MTDDLGLYVYLRDDDWASLEAGKLYPLEIQFGRRDPWTGDASGHQSPSGAIYLSLRVQEDLAADFLKELSDCLLFVEGKAAGVVEAKKSGVTLSGIADQTSPTAIWATYPSISPNGTTLCSSIMKAPATRRSSGTSGARSRVHEKCLRSIVQKLCLPG